MNTLQKTLVAIAAGSLLSVSAQAAIYGGTGVGQPYVGAKVGQYDVDAEDAEDAKDAFSYGVVGGYKFDPNFGVEAEYLRTSKTDAGDNNKYQADVLGAYGTYDYTIPNSPFYAKVRLGITKNKIKVEIKDNNQSGTISVSDTGLAGGVGVGYNVMPNVTIEGMYNFYPKIKGENGDGDIKTKGLTVGANVKF